MKNNHKINRSEKIILFLYDMGKGEKKKFSYEDIVVGLFKKYPEDFHLKGYPEYPDSSDSTQRLLYEFKKKGYITVLNKIFSLTESGLEACHQLSTDFSENTDLLSNRLSRSSDVEVNRIKKLEGFNIFVHGKVDTITESDFYNYLGISVRSSASTFSGRLNTVNDVIRDLRQMPTDPLYSQIIKYHEFMMERYEKAADYFIKK